MRTVTKPLDLHSGDEMQDYNAKSQSLEAEMSEATELLLFLLLLGEWTGFASVALAEPACRRELRALAASVQRK